MQYGVSLCHIAMKLFHIPAVIRWLYPQYTWRRPADENKIYLTFDDGPAELCSWILDELDRHQAKATFFCVGGNVEKYPDQYARILERGHATANHTHNHLKGWKTADKEYVENVRRAAQLIRSKLFRPPYGRIKRSQAKKLMQEGYEVMMWSLLTYDFDSSLDKEKAWEQIQKGIKSGAIILFHDNLKAEENIKYLLPETLHAISAKGLQTALL